MRLHCAALLAAVIPGCATTLYDGPRRPDHEIATIGGLGGITIKRIDEHRMDGGAFDVLPGTHLVGADYRNSTGSSLFSLAICFRAEAGRSYFVRGEVLEYLKQWELVVADPGTGETVHSWAVPFSAQDCLQPVARPQPRSGSSKRLTLAVPKLLGVPVSGDDAGNPAGGETPGQEAPPPEATEASAPELAAGPRPLEATGPEGIPADMPPRPSAPMDSPATGGDLEGEGASRGAAPSGPRPMHRPGTGGGIEGGGSIGGAELATAELSNGDHESLSAGGGGMIALLASWTPLWLGNAVGLGVAGTIGFKDSEIGGSNGALTLLRFPASLSLQTLLPLSGHVFLLARAGLLKELGVHLRGTGIAEPLSLRMHAPLAPQYEGGFLYESISQAAVGFSIRYTSLRYETEFGSADASNVTILGGFYFFM